MNIEIKLSDGAILPQCAHESDTGYDVFAFTEPQVIGKLARNGFYSSIDYIEYDTGISIAPEALKYNLQPHLTKYGFLDVRPRSSISKYNLVLANPPATIDHAYRGTIKLRFKYMWQPEDMRFDALGHGICKINMDKIYKKGDKIGQLVAVWKEPIKWKVVETLSETSRSAGGFGSSGT